MMTWAELIAALRGLPLVGEAPALQPRYNIRPGEREGTLLLRTREDGQVHPDRLKWGFRPDAKKSFAPVNAKAETLFEKWPWKFAARHRRCLVPLDGFYEPKGPKTQRNRPQYFFRFDEQRPFFVAGIWTQKTDVSPLDTFALVTCAPNDQVAPIHARMPAILTAESCALWLSDSEDTAALQGALVPWAGEPLTSWEVERRWLNEADDERCIAPL